MEMKTNTYVGFEQAQRATDQKNILFICVHPVHLWLAFSLMSGPCWYLKKGIGSGHHHLSSRLISRRAPAEILPEREMNGNAP